jgi:hypothetical protein
MIRRSAHRTPRLLAFVALAAALVLFIEGGLNIQLGKIDGAGHDKTTSLSQSDLAALCANDGPRSDSHKRGHSGANCALCVAADFKNFEHILSSTFSLQLFAILQPPKIDRPRFDQSDEPFVSGLDGWMNAWSSQGPPSA